MRGQLILTDETLRVLFAVLPDSRMCDELMRARDVNQGGHLTIDQAHGLADVLARAVDDPYVLIKRSCLREATQQLREALRLLDLTALDHDGRHTVSVFVWDAWRDGPAPIFTLRVELVRA